LVAQIAVPLFLLGRVAFIRSRSSTSLGIDVALGAVYLVALALTIPALAAPWYLPHLFGGILVAAAVIGARRRTDPPAGRRRWPALISLSARGGLALLFAAIAAYAFLGRRPPEARPVR